jgi:hypothetical protein
MANQGNKRPRDREGNPDKAGEDANSPTGTSGRQSGNTGTGVGDTVKPPRRRTNNDDEESGLGNRNTFR